MYGKRNRLRKESKYTTTNFVFNIKSNSYVNVDMYKARIIVKGFAQGKETGTCSPIVNFNTIRTALTIAVRRGMVIHQMDARTAFLHGENHEAVYVSPPPCLILCDAGQAMLLKKGMYRLKQASKV